MKMLLTEKKKPLTTKKEPLTSKKEYIRIAAALVTILSLVIVTLLPGCTGKNEPELGETGLIHEPEFGARV